MSCLLDQLKSRLPPTFRGVCQRSKERLQNFTIKVHPDPVFVLGNQKSGTTAIASLLAQACGSDFSNDMFYRLPDGLLADLLEHRLAFNAFVRRHRKYFASAVIKSPSLTFFYTELKACFPEARFVFVVRDPRDNVRSILDRLNLQGTLSELPRDFHRRWPRGHGWGMALDGRLCGHQGRTIIETLALRWNLMTDVFLSEPSGFSCIRYEDFSKDKVRAVEGLARHCGLAPTVDVSSRVDIQYQPKGNRTVSWLDFFGAANLRTIESVCAERMTDFDYEPSMPAPRG